MIRRFLLCLLMICLSVTLAWAGFGVVRTRDNRFIEGEVTDKGAEGVTITTPKGATLHISQAEVAQITYGANLREVYEKLLADLPADANPQAHYNLARWLFDNRLYDLANVEVAKALRLNPNYAEATVLQQTIRHTERMERARQISAPPVRDPVAPPTDAPPGPLPAVERRHLDADQINAIRLGELRKTDRNVKVRLDNRVSQRFIEYDNWKPNAFAALPDFEKALQILTRGTPEMRQDVRITNDPQALLDFKRLQSGLIQNCATAGCHGGPNAGSFVLHAPANTDPITYTNFYILTQYTTDVGGVRRHAINRTQPTASLILEYGLPHDRAELDHPDVQGWAHLYRNKQDPRYVEMLRWVRDGLLPVPVPPNYGIDLPLPSTKTPEPAATQPVPRE